jgi:peptidylprolyl isomerase/peptidyl-prolyl cis-trans isomerase D
MGFMQKLRQNMPAVVIFLAIMFVALIIVEWGDAKRGQGAVRSGSTAIGLVNGEEISAADFEARVEALTLMQRQQNPDAEVDDQQIRDAVWDQMVNEILLRQEADRLGIQVTDEQLKEVLLFNPPQFLKQQFADSTGVFNESLYRAFMNDASGFLRQQGQPPERINEVLTQIKQLERDIKVDLLRQAVESAVTASAISSLPDLRTAFTEQRTKISGTYASLPVTVIPDEQVKISDAEARQYYDAHKADFVQKASREVRYVMFPLNPSAGDSANVRKRLTTVTTALGRTNDPRAKDSIFAGFVDTYGAGSYNGSSYTPLQELSPELQNALQGATKGQVIGPVRLTDGTYLINVVDIQDSGETYVKAQHILLRTAPNDDSVRAEAEKLAARVRGGESIETLAQQFSGDPGSAARGGDLGYFKRGMMVKAFEDAAFGAAPGSIVGPIKTEHGYHIIKVNEKTTRAYKIRDLRFDVKTSNPTRNNLKRRASTFQKKLVEGGSIDSIAAKETPAVQVYESGPIERNTPAAGTMRLTYFAYGGNVGDVSDPIEMNDGSIMVAQLTKVRNAGAQDFDDAKAGIIEKLRNQKKLDMLKARAEKMRTSLAAGDSLGKLRAIEPAVEVTPFTDVVRTSPFPGVGFDYALTAGAFNLQQGQTSTVLRGERGYYIVRVDRRVQPTDQEFAAERQQFTQQLLTQRRQSLFQDWLRRAREQANIEDFRGSL